MKAIMLAAGLGRRLFGDENHEPPKALLRFDGRSLMRRHIDALRALDIEDLTLVVGHGQEALLAEVAGEIESGFVKPIFNADYRHGPILSLWMARQVLMGGDDVLFMDADVLYHPDLLARLVRSPQANCFLFDAAIDAGDEPVRLCLRGGLPVDFGKQIEGDFEQVGEWPGFMRMGPGIAAGLAAAIGARIDLGQIDLAYEPAMRDVLMAAAPGTFAIEDITGIPWIEIDFAQDLERARTEVFAAIAGAG